MKELVKFELYKVFTQKSIYFVAIILLALTLFFLFQMRGPSLYYLYKKWEGPITSHEIQTAQKKDKAIADKQDRGLDITFEELKLRNVYNDVLNIGRYQNKQESTIQNIDKQMKYLMDKGITGYTYRNLNLQKEMVSKIKFQELYYQRPAAEIIDFIGTYGLVFLGALILVGISPIFTQESITGVDQYILSSKHGRRAIVHAKIITSIILNFESKVA